MPEAVGRREDVEIVKKKKKSPNYNEGQMSLKNLFNTMTVIANNTLHAWKFLREWILTVITTKIIVQGYGYLIILI